MLIGFSTGADLILCMRNNRTYLSKTDSKNIHCRKCSMYIHSHITVWLLKICFKILDFLTIDLQGFLLCLNIFQCLKFIQSTL